MNATNNIAKYCSAAIMACLILTIQAAYAEIAGHAQFVMGNVQIIDAAKQTRSLLKGMPVNEGDTLVTARNANAQIKMQDGGFVAIRPDTQLKIDSFKFSGKEDGSEKLAFSLLKGGFRSVTGLIGRLNKPNYRITTAVATIGIRGTDHETFVVTPESPLAASVPAGAYNKVNLGETFIKTDKGTIFVLPNQMGYAGASNQMPVLKPPNAELFTVANKPSQSAKRTGVKSEATTNNEEVREAASVDNTAEEMATPEPELASGSIKSAENNIVQNINTENDICISCPQQDYAALAQVAASAAKSAELASIAAQITALQTNTELALVAQVDSAPASAAIVSANNAITNAAPLVNNALLLTPVSGLAPGSVSTAQSTTDNVVTMAATAQASLTANGTFADNTAVIANNLINAPLSGAAALVQAANDLVQIAAGPATTVGSISYDNAALALAQSNANTSLSNANTNLESANTSLSNVSGKNTAIVNAQTSASSLLAQAQSAVFAAQIASLAAQEAAALAVIFQESLDFTGAAEQLAIAQHQQTVAQQQQAIAQNATASLSSLLTSAQTAQTSASNAVTSAINSSNTAITDSTSAENHASAAQTAVTNADAKLTNATNQLPVIDSNAATVALNAPIAAYNNPADASAVWTPGGTGIVEVATGQYRESIANQSSPAASATPNTSYVLDGSGSLVEMRHANFYEAATFMSGAFNTVNDADIKYSGAAASEAYSTADHSLYLGRLQGGTMTVTDNANLIAPQTYNLGPTSVQWMLINLTSPNFVQSLTGTTSYTLVNATSPSDALGNVGTLNSASLTINFSSMTVDTLIGLAIAGKTLGVAALAVPIAGSVASANPETGNGASVTCSGAACAASYLGRLTVLLAGDTASNAGVGYTLWPTAPTGSLVTDIIQGGLAFHTGTPPTVQAGGTYAAYLADNFLISMTSSSFGSGNNYMVAPADITYTSGSPTSFTQRSNDNTWTETSSVLGASSPINGMASSGTTGIQFGRWTGVNGMEQSWTQMLGHYGMPSFWMYGTEGYLDPGITAFGGQMYGTFNYVLDASTPPTDWQTGQTGTLTSASLGVDFVNNLFNANLALNISGTDWQVNASNAPLYGGASLGASYDPLSGGNLSIYMGVGTTPTLCTNCSGNLYGNFTEQNYAGAILNYYLSNGNNFNAYITGAVALARDPAVPIANGAPAPTGNYYVSSGYGGYGQQIDALTTTGGVLTAYSWLNPAIPQASYHSTTVSCTTCTVAAPTANTARTGIYLGTWDAGSITSTWGTTVGTSGPVWIAGPEAGPLFLGNALVGSKTYSFDGGMVTNANGVAGTVLGTTALTVDFTRQVVGVNLDLSVPDTATGALHNWNATTLAGNEAVIQSDSGIGGVAFWAESYAPTGSGLLMVTVDGVTPGNGSLSGQLTGAGLNGGILSYNLNAMIGAATPINEQITGVAAFAGAASDVATPHRLVMASLTDPNPSIFPASAYGFYANAPARVLTDGAGNLTQFDIDSIKKNNSGTTYADGSMTLQNGTSVLTNAGNDAVTGISWGRWEGGDLVTIQRSNGMPTPARLTGSLHWIAGPTETAAVTLPVSGTYVYTHAGGTVPTDNLGNAGTLNSATLSANFTAMTVDVGVDVTVAGANMVGAAANVPILQSTAFFADSTSPLGSSSHLAVTCTGAPCGTAAQGTILGGFTGTGATGATMIYGFENSSATTTQVVSGAAAFHR